MQILVQSGLGEARDSVFLAHSEVMLSVTGPHLEERGSGRQGPGKAGPAP